MGKKNSAKILNNLLKGPVWTSVISQNSWELQTQVEFIFTCDSSTQTSKGCSWERLSRGRDRGGFPSVEWERHKAHLNHIFLLKSLGKEQQTVPVCSIASIVADSWQPYGLQTTRPLCMQFFKQEYWSGFPCPPPGDIPDPGIKPVSPVFLHCRGIHYRWATWEAPNKFCHPSMEGDK